MVFRVEVGLRKDMKDPEGATWLRRIHNDLNIEKVSDVRVLKVYLIDCEGIDIKQVNSFANEVLADPVTEVFETSEILADNYQFDWLIETGFLPGVTDNEGKTALWGLKTFLGSIGDNDMIFSGRKYLVSGRIEKNAAEIIGSKLFANGLIQRYSVVSFQDWAGGKKIGNSVPRVKSSSVPVVETVSLDVSDEELITLSRAKVLALNLEEMKAMRDYFRKKEVLEYRKQKGFPKKATDCEIEVIAQTWSEHCKHKIFAADINYSDKVNKRDMQIRSLYKSYIKKVTYELRESKPWIKSVFDDNAGIIQIDGDTLFAMKVETHNSPSALDPYGGALTGIVGVNRDIIGCGIGAKPILNTDVFCFASPYYEGTLPGSNLMHPARIFRGVHRGVKDGGNESGIPVVNGSIFFDNRYIGKPLVFCGTGGLMPVEINGHPAHLKKARIGDLIVMSGGRVGKDGIHGATFSSEELHEGSPVTAVQIGDAIVQKRMLDFIIEARDKELYNAITDNGAGGLSSSIGEMARDTGGAEINLEKVPLKYQGLQPWEIFISEAQERMTIAIDPARFDELKKIADIHEVEISVVGKFTDTGYLEIYYEDMKVALLDMEFMHDGNPRYKLEAEWDFVEKPAEEIEDQENLNAVLLDMMGRVNIASKENWVRQYDHEVQGRSAGKPFCGVEHDGPSDAGVLRVSPFKKNAIVVSHGIKPTFSDIDCYWMTASVVDEAVRNAVATGADPDFMSGLDNFCWPDPVYDSDKNPDGKHKLAQLVRSNMALYDFCRYYSIPLISGKDSMKNDYGSGKNKISIPPTLLFTLISKMDDVENMVSMDFKNEGDRIFIIGETKNELGGSEYYIYHGINRDGFIPKVDAGKFMRSYKLLKKAIDSKLVKSAHDLSDGGFATALSESAFAGALGAKVDLRKIPRSVDVTRNDTLMFSESNGRIIVSVAPANVERFLEVMKGTDMDEIGEVTSSGFVKMTGLDGSVVVNLSINELKKNWKGLMSRMN
ncbi:MAG TPA: phosphoribosylformylglycinamidine synthase subunit PurL [bacterium]|jgi:phosphoribosylformylglycinamidine synthase|nr:phosphoribosylformylglycinamidine synthase subunit PurL [bacterium]HQO91642.1 phosphoribosylformylglycinamidine synthase subunit PurL [bacterium]